MARIENALMPFVIMIIAINAMFMFMTYLPNNTEGTSTYQFGLSQTKQDEIEGWYMNLKDDMNALSNSTTGVTGSTEARTDIDLLGALLGGLGLALNAPSLILNLVNFILMILFGFLFWIDYFFAPIIAGFAGFVWIAWIIKGIFLIIQLVGLVYLFMMIYSGFRK
ncbi:MAG: hypothetical protein GX950_03865 [Candidatus Diapherotrites archaeon]|jgi:hypothetical protein|uniref:Uncharacterized protein n=1 Tax=Candidatus Iainarchaeum sp. TaxID=3101447 RepID=A0A7K4C0A4_9ARCH|nr:hypothetical protein [Candidatus Diapherotrites archaeon]